MSEFCFLSRWLLFWANLINKELDLGSFHFLISSKFWSHWFLKGTVGEREKLFSQPRVWEQKLTLNSSSNEQSWMLAYEGRGNRVFWGHPGLCCGKVEKVIVTPQGERCILARTEGRVESQGKDDRDSGVQWGAARIKAERWGNQETKNGSVELEHGIYKKQRVRGAWGAQLAKLPTSAQVMVSWFMGSSPSSGSMLSARSPQPASESVSPSLSAPPLLMVSLSLSKINIKKQKQKKQQQHVRRREGPEIKLSLNTASQGECFINGELSLVLQGSQVLYEK